jgi:rSAM/selenodomain-associated transferase 2
MNISIIMPALDEEQLIGYTLAETRRVAPGAELIVVDGGSRDRTPAIARNYAPVVTARCGRAPQMNAGAMLAHGDVLLFQHADTWLPDGALTLVEQALADPHVVGGAFALAFDEDGWFYKRMARDTNRRSWEGYYSGDQCMFIRRDVFFQIGGYPDIALMEDLELSNLMRRAGPVNTITTPVITSARRHRTCGVLNVLLLCWRIRLLYALGVHPNVLKRMYPDVR